MKSITILQSFLCGVNTPIALFGYYWQGMDSPNRPSLQWIKVLTHIVKCAILAVLRTEMSAPLRETVGLRPSHAWIRRPAYPVSPTIDQSRAVYRDKGGDEPRQERTRLGWLLGDIRSRQEEPG